MNLFELFCKISLDPSDYERGLEGASEKTHTFGDKLKSGLAAAAKITAAGVAAATTAIGALTKASVEGYGEYEQLTGGVETLFKTSADVVMEYANNAYKTAGLSANEYMETVTSFSASLLQSLDNDTAAAAEKANMAITDISDNVNKMGSTTESVQNAYQGFAKQNFTMLDNLKLGYGGTKEEMQRLLDDAEKLSGIKYDISSFADISDAIHVVQTEMGITGTTAKEAATTIQGSVASAKSAWQNLVTGIADENADLGLLIGNFVDSVGTAVQNIIPRVEQILTGIGTAVQKLAPIISEQLPPLVTAVLPSMISSGGQLLTGLITGIISALPSLGSAAPQIVQEIGSSLSDNWPAIEEAGSQLLDMLVNGVSGNLPILIPTALGAVLEFVDGLTSPENLSELADGAIAILEGLAKGITDSIDILFDKGPEIVQNIVDAIIENAPKMWDAAIGIIDELGNKLSEELPGLSVVFENLETVVAAVAAAFVAFKAATAISGVISALTNVTNLQTIAQAALNAIMNANPFVLVATLIAAVGTALVTLYMTNEDFRNKVQEVWGKIKEIFSEAWENIKSIWNEVKPYFTAAWEAIKVVWDNAVGYFENIWNTIKGIFAVVEAVLSGNFSDAWEAIKNVFLGWEEYFQGLWNTVTGIFSGVKEWFEDVGRNLLEGLWNGINDKVEWLKGKVTGVVDTIKGWFTGSSGFDEHSPSKWANQVFRYVMEGGGEGLEEGLPALMGNVSNVVDSVKSGMQFGTANVDFAASAVGQSSAAIINSASGGEGGAPVIPLTINLLTGDSRPFAEWILGDLIAVARERGTPITSGIQYA